MTAYMQTRLRANFRFYRLGYNILSFTGLVLLLGYGQSLSGEVWFAWDGLLANGFRAVVAVFSAVVVYLAAREYDMASFLGIRQLRNQQMHRTLAADGGIKRTGILGLVRHPLYAALFPLIWLRTLTTTAIIENTLICIYLVIGTLLEEQKLVREHGTAYTSYQQEVSMFFPWKWIFKNKQ